jgi:hypothetical protein
VSDVSAEEKLRARLRRSEIEARYARDEMATHFASSASERAVEDAARCFRYAIEMRDAWWVGCGEDWLYGLVDVDGDVRARARILADMVVAWISEQQKGGE